MVNVVAMNKNEKGKDFHLSLFGVVPPGHDSYRGEPDDTHSRKTTLKQKWEDFYLPLVCGTTWN